MSPNSQPSNLQSVNCAALNDASVRSQRTNSQPETMAPSRSSSPCCTPSKRAPSCRGASAKDRAGGLRAIGVLLESELFGGNDQVGQHVKVDGGETPKVKAALACPVLAQRRQLRGAFRQAGRQVNAHVGLARREGR